MKVTSPSNHLRKKMVSRANKIREQTNIISLTADKGDFKPELVTPLCHEESHVFEMVHLTDQAKLASKLQGSACFCVPELALQECITISGYFYVGSRE